AQNPDTFFQAREACNPFYDACAGHVKETFEQFAELTGRRYDLFDYVGDPEAERVVVMMGAGAETAHETVEWMQAQGEKVGLVKVRLYRPFSMPDFIQALPKTTKKIAILDRTKEPGALCEPLHLDVLAALDEAREQGISSFAADPDVVGGRYGLSSNEFTPSMVKAVFDNLDAEKPKNHFTIGIYDDVTNRSLPFDESFDIEPDDVVRGVFFGLGSDGTVGANKNSVKIIGEETPNNAQGYFVYDSKKAGAITISHLRFGPRPIRSTYLIKKASFVACHQFVFLDRYEMVEVALPGGVFLLNSPYGPDEVWDKLPREVQQGIVEKKLKFYVIDALKVAEATGMGTRINTIMQTCFFAISGVLPREEAIEKIKDMIRETYEKKGEEVVQRNFEAVDQTLANLFEVSYPQEATAQAGRPPVVSPEAPDFVQQVTAEMIAYHGDAMPVSAFPPDGTWPVGTCQWEKRNIANEIPVWDPDVCIQCNKCALVCPHATIRPKVYDPALVENGKAPETFKWTDSNTKEFKGLAYTLQVAPEDCTGCKLCVVVCPAKNKAEPSRKAINMEQQRPLREQESENYAFFLDLPEIDRSRVKTDVKGSQLFVPLFEYSGACAGCGETPYVKLLTQLFGDRALISNATGCSSIYGGNLPTTPYTTDRQGRGPAWSNSLFEDNGEFGFGFRLAVDAHARQATDLLRGMGGEIGDDLVGALLNADQSDEQGIAAQRERVTALREVLSKNRSEKARRLELLADYLVKKSVWLLGGDGWAYDIGFGGLDHVMAMGRDVNILVLDTEVYSNTGGQQSKATPMGAAAKFAMAGKTGAKKDLGMMAMSYGNVYVARVAFGSKDTQTVQAFKEAESYSGTSLIIAYSHCIAHGYDLMNGCNQQKLAVDSGLWPLYRFDPRRLVLGEPPLKLDSGKPKVAVETYTRNETRFRMVEKLDKKRFAHLLEEAQRSATQRFAVYQQLAGLTVPVVGNGDGDSNTDE
ncbi:MAG: pyruvate:ferredoxin (flavodoxin) oxidoreductase, partial [Candidatus Eisenbacteria bacterium]|nr:pyruvate:ferredoxin (flavodoxin) oxidoreductase [Candidatus Latescibacterota bacterium]MBD3302263.1 pyruvate:ferredoxin (flavodoxin) oxidoreductase [Candidatus Eisenbacteria bacterium]